jgi:hypothetical protein
MQLDPTKPANIIALPTFTISPSNIIRGNAWGRGRRREAEPRREQRGRVE